jgi:cyclopropane fatty-acyl-phospholipid synthase-like methyltransferase
MLREHLSQAHDRASRRFEVVDAHVAWIHEGLLAGRADSILDLGCGPGFYCERLARRGHRCVGIDFSPASIAHAQAEAQRQGLACEYRLEDLAEARLAEDFGLALLVFGEFNTFAPEDARALLSKLRRALRADGVLVLEVHTEEAVRQTGQQPPRWFTADSSVFSDEPHLCLTESAWHSRERAATEQHFVVSLASGETTPYVNTLQAWSDEEYEALLRAAGFARVTRQPSLSGSAADADPSLFALVAHAG